MAKNGVEKCGWRSVSGKMWVAKCEWQNVGGEMWVAKCEWQNEKWQNVESDEL